MARTDRFRQQHAALVTLVLELEAMLNPTAIGNDAGPVRTLLSKILGSLKVHISIEDEVFYPELSASKDAAVAALAKRFSSEMAATAKVIDAYSKKWPTPSVIKAQPAPFIADTRQIISALKDRIKRENNELYAAADRVEGAAF